MDEFGEGTARFSAATAAIAAERQNAASAGASTPTAPSSACAAGRQTEGPSEQRLQTAESAKNDDSHGLAAFLCNVLKGLADVDEVCVIGGGGETGESMFILSWPSRKLNILCWVESVSCRYARAARTQRGVKCFSANWYVLAVSHIVFLLVWGWGGCGGGGSYLF